MDVLTIIHMFKKQTIKFEVNVKLEQKALVYIAVRESCDVNDTC